MKFINTGVSQNDGTGDTMIDACEKINQNFEEVFKSLKLKEPVKVIVWKTLEDTWQAMEDVNSNFKEIQKHLSF
jgi:hypothetical protein